MKNAIFEFHDYKRYLRELIAAQPKKGFGVRSKLAQAVGCQVAYISQILNGPVHLNLEQAMRVNKFFGHSREEGHFLVLLIQHSRAGDQETRDYFQQQIDEEIAQRLLLKKRLGMARTLTSEDQVTYYSSWHYAAVHMLVTIPEFRTRAAIAQRLNLPMRKLGEVLEFLVRTGLLEQKGDQFVTGQALIHLEKNSRQIARHHSNWLLRAMESLEREDDTAVHFSGVVTVSKNDLRKIKAMLVKHLEEVFAVVKPSKEEELAAISVDFFRV